LKIGTILGVKRGVALLARGGKRGGNK